MTMSMMVATAKMSTMPGNLTHCFHSIINISHIFRYTIYLNMIGYNVYTQYRRNMVKKNRKVINVDEVTYQRLLQQHSKTVVPDSFSKLINRLVDFYEKQNKKQEEKKVLERPITN
jgi:hypothetical protein